jgi:hypothetical protein
MKITTVPIQILASINYDSEGETHASKSKQYHQRCFWEK